MNAWRTLGIVRTAILLTALSFVCSCTGLVSGNKPTVATTMTDTAGTGQLRPLSAAAIVANVLLGAGVFARPAYVNCSFNTNGENEVMVCSDENSLASGESVAKVLIQDEIIRVEGNAASQRPVDPDGMALERAVALAVTWAATMEGGGYERFRVEAARGAHGEIVVFFEDIPEIGMRTYGGHFMVKVRDGVIVLVPGK